jgi:hypothetical protein
MATWTDRHPEPFRREVERLRRGVQIAQLKHAAGVQPSPEVRAFVKRTRRRVQVILLRMAAEETASELEHTGNRRATLRQILDGPLDRRRGLRSWCPVANRG